MVQMLVASADLVLQVRDTLESTGNLVPVLGITGTAIGLLAL